MNVHLLCTSPGDVVSLQSSIFACKVYDVNCLLSFMQACYFTPAKVINFDMRFPSPPSNPKPAHIIARPSADRFYFLLGIGEQQRSPAQLSDLSAATLERVTAYCEHHKDDDPAALQDLHANVGAGFDAMFATLDQPSLFNCILVCAPCRICPQAAATASATNLTACTSRTALIFGLHRLCFECSS